MKIALMARNPNLYSHRRLVAAAEERGHEIQIIDTLKVVYQHRLAPAGNALQGREA
jgi:hypothetical protein